MSSLEESQARLMAELGAGVELYYCPAVDSTNTRLKQLAAAGGLRGPALLFCSWQYSGRGTRGREWTQPQLSAVRLKAPGTLSSAWLPRDIALSLAIPRERAALRDERLSLAVGAIAALALEQALAGLATACACPAPRVAVKWPNDLLCAPGAAAASELRKVGGILIETSSAGTARDWLFIGVGVNVNSRLGEYPEELRQRLTTLHDCLPVDCEAGCGSSQAQDIDVLALLSAVALCLARELGLGVDGDGAGAELPDMPRLMGEWLRRDRTRGTPYMLTRGGQTFRVTADHVIAQTGELVCFDERGAQYVVRSFTELSRVEE